MRKVSSAPSLVEVGQRASADYHGGSRLSAKSSSSGSLNRIGGSHPKASFQLPFLGPSSSFPLLYMPWLAIIADSSRVSQLLFSPFIASVTSFLTQKPCYNLRSEYKC